MAEPHVGEELGEAAAAWSASPPKAVFVTHVVKLVLWGMVLCGPVGVALGSGEGMAVPPSPSPPPALRSSSGPEGFAQRYVTAYLSGGDLKPYSPNAPSQPTTSNRKTVSTTVASVREVEPGYWSITVAASGRFFMVPVVAVGSPESGGTAKSGAPVGYAATALPAQVAGPLQVAAPEVAATHPVTAAAETEAVANFLAAYLAGKGELSRYLTPGVRLAPVRPAPYRSVVIRSLAADRELEPAASENGVPPDGTTLRVLAEVEAQRRKGEPWPLTYQLTLTARAARWEISSIDPAPMVKGGS